MKGLLVHGCYDPATLSTLSDLGVESLGLDLRARSSNLIPFRTLRELLPQISSREIVLIFGDDSRDTIFSFLDLLKDTGKTFLLEFRDKRPAEFYESIGKTFLWYFSPDADWMKILSVKNCGGVILPLKHQELYHHLPHLWTLIEEKNLRLWLHAENFSEAEFFEGKKNIQPSIDLSGDVQRAYRSVDQAQLKNMKLWRKLNESAAGQ